MSDFTLFTSIHTYCTWIDLIESLRGSLTVVFTMFNSADPLLLINSHWNQNRQLFVIRYKTISWAKVGEQSTPSSNNSDSNNPDSNNPDSNNPDNQQQHRSQ